MTRSSLLGSLSIFLGTIILVFSIGALLMRAFIVLVGLGLINFGLKLQGSVPLQYRAYNWFNRSAFRGW